MMNDSEIFPKTNALRETYLMAEEATFRSYADPEDEPVLDIAIEELRMEFVSKVSKSYLSEAKSYEKRGVYYKGCAFQVYKKHYPERLNTYIEMYGEDATEEDFIIDELNDPKANTFLLDEHVEKTIGLSLRKTENFLKHRLSMLGFGLTLVLNDQGRAYDFKRKDYQRDESNSINDSLDIDLKGTKKMILLHELGILEFIEGKMRNGISRMSTARIVAQIIDEKTLTVYGKINQILNNTIGQRNNPYTGKNADEKITAVRHFLVDNGISLD